MRITRDELKNYSEEAIRVRRQFHANPELSFEEHETSDYLREQLTSYGVEFEEGYSNTSIACYVNGAQDGPTIAFRADIDALPVQELTDLPYKSKKDGIMHACGHDAHAAVLLMMAKYFSEHRDLVKGRIKFLFQCAEEKLPGGAKTFCEERVLHDVDEIYAWHATSLQPIGEVNFAKGPATAGVAAYRLAITGKGGHGGYPHLSNNPILCATAIVQSLNQILGTKVDAKEPSIFTTAYIQAGTDWVPNVIPEECVIGGNIRSLSNDARDVIVEETERICKGICETYNCDYDLDMMIGYPATINSPRQYDVVKSVLDDMGIKITNPEAQMGAEDFAYYTLEKPGAYIMIGMKGSPEGEPPTPHHNGNFCINDEEGVPLALEFITNTYLRAVEA